MHCAPVCAPASTDIARACAGRRAAAAADERRRVELEQGAVTDDRRLPHLRAARLGRLRLGVQGQEEHRSTATLLRHERGALCV